MHSWAYYLVVLWLIALAAVVALYPLITRSTVQRALALDTLALLLVAVLAVIAVKRDEAGFLDIALVLAMLGFVQTVATARLVERRRELQ